ncbi:MAG TPA: hypothetical protein VI072_09710 [Polyangiaceae bacterium]
MKYSRLRLAGISVALVAAVHCDNWTVWDAVFDRKPPSGTRGWTGGDGGVAVPMPGNRTLWIFGDSKISGYDSATGERTWSPPAVSLLDTVFGNTIGYQTNSSTPSASNIQFYARTAASGAVAQITSNVTVHHGAYFNYATLNLSPPPPPQGHANIGLWPAGGTCLNCSNPQQSALVLAFMDTITCSVSQADPECLPLCGPPGCTCAGQACPGGFKVVSTALTKVTNMTTANGNPIDPTVTGAGGWQVANGVRIASDVLWGVSFVEAVVNGTNWIYIYGQERNFGTPQGLPQNLYLARATAASILTPSQWQFYKTGGTFQTSTPPPNKSQLQVVAANIGPFPSVSTITRRGITKHVLTYDDWAKDHFLYVRTSNSLTSWGAVDKFTPKADLAAMDSSIQTMQAVRYLRYVTDGDTVVEPLECKPWTHNGEDDFRGCGVSYHGTAHPHISTTDAHGISALNFSYIVPNGHDDTNDSQAYYRPKFGFLPMDNLPDWCGAASQTCWRGIGRWYNERPVGASAEVHYTYDVSAAAGLSFPTHAFSAEIVGGSGNPDLYVRFGSSPPTTTTFNCRSNTATTPPTESCRLAVPSGTTTARVMVRGATAGNYSLRVAYAGN